jgi:hypothetical protein
MFPNYKAETKPRWDIAARMLAEDFQPGDILYLQVFYANKLLEIYLARDKSSFGLDLNDAYIYRAVRTLSQGKHVWAVMASLAKVRDKPKSKAAKLTKAASAVHATLGSRFVIALYGPNKSSGG